MIGLDEIAADLDATHRRAALDDLRHPAAMQLPAMSGSLQALGKLHAEGMAVGDLLVRRVDAADEGRGGQGRLQREALGGGQDELRRRIGQTLAGPRKAGRLAKRHQLAVAPPVEAIEAILLAPGLQGALAEQCQAQQVRGIAAVQRAAAGREEAQQPAPLRRIKARPQAQRRIVAQQPAERLGRHAAVGQWRHVAIGQLPAIGVAGFQPAPLARFHQGHVESFANQGVGRGQADHAGADDANPLSHDNRYPGVFQGFDDRRG